MVDRSVMGGVRFEDYKVTNPAAIQFDPAQRIKALAALGASTADTLSQAPPTFATPAPTVTFQASGVQAQIYYQTPAASFSPSEYLDVHLTNLTASNGFSSPSFSFQMTRQLALDGSEVPQYSIFGSGPTSITGFIVDPVGPNATFTGSMQASAQLNNAILGVLLNAQAILEAANFTVTNPAPPGKTLWTTTELIGLAGQARPWIAASASTNVALGPPYTCEVTQESGYGTCNGGAQINAFNNMILGEGGEYLGLRTQQSFNILMSNLRTWAAANAPSLDPSYAAAMREFPQPTGRLLTIGS